MTGPARCWRPFVLDWLQAAAVLVAILLGLAYFTARVDDMLDDLTARASAHWEAELVESRRIEAKVDAMRAELEAERRRRP